MDIDWEFPDASSKSNFPNLLKALKDAGGDGFIVTAAVSANTDTAGAGLDLGSIANIVDYLNVMAYDFHGTWESQTGVNAPLNGDGSFTDTYVINWYIQQVSV